MNRTITKLCAAAIALSALASAIDASAAPCQVTKNKWGQWVGDCKLSDFFPEINYTIVASSRPTISFRMPNLSIDDVDYWVSGTSVDVGFTIENDGVAQSAATTVAGVITVTQAGNTVITQPFSLAIPAIPAGASASNTTNVSLPNRTYDYDFVVMATVDPPTSAQTSGAVRESDETDNDKVTRMCRVYSLKNPETSVRACN